VLPVAVLIDRKGWWSGHVIFGSCRLLVEDWPFSASGEHLEETFGHGTGFAVGSKVGFGFTSFIHVTRCVHSPSLKPFGTLSLVTVGDPPADLQ